MKRTLVVLFVLISSSVYAQNPIRRVVTGSAFVPAGSAPTNPSSPSPSDSATNVSTSGNLSISGCTGATTYTFIGPDTANPPTTPSNTVGVATQSFSGLLNSTTYFWKVTCTNSFGTNPSSSVYSFTTVAAGVRTSVNLSTDITYLGAFWAPGELSSSSWGAFSGRYVNGELHFFSNGINTPELITTIASNSSTTGGTLGDVTGLNVGDGLYIGSNEDAVTLVTVDTGTKAVTWTPALSANPGNGTPAYSERDLLWEFKVATPVIPNDAYTPTNLNTAVVYKKWGPYRKGKDWFQTNNRKTQSAPRPGFGWIGSGQLLWTFVDNYNVTNNNDRSLGMAVLNDADGASNCTGQSYLCYNASSVTTYCCWFSANSHKGHKGVTAVPASFANTYLGGGNWISVSAGLSSGDAGADWGNSLHVVNAPTTSTPDDTQLGNYKALISYPYNTDPALAHRMKRSNDFTTYSGNTFYKASVDASPAPTSTSISVTPIPGVVTTGAAGIPTGPDSIYVCPFNDIDCGGSIRAIANVSNISGSVMTINITSGSTPIAGDRVHGGHEGVYPFTNPVQSTGVITDWISNHTPGTGTPSSGNGYITQSDESYSNAMAWIDTDTKASLIEVYYLCTGSAWYGSWQNDGANNIDPSTGTTGPLCTAEHPYISSWAWSTFGPIASSGNPWDAAQPDSVLDLATVSNFLYAKKDYYTHTGVANKGGPRPGVDGVYFDPVDTCGGTCAGKLYVFSRHVHMVGISEQYPVINVFSVAR